MFRPISRLVAAAEGVKAALRDVRDELLELCAAYRALGPAVERLEALERQRQQFEATCEGLLQKAEGKLGAARNAEARERANKRSYAHLLDPLAEDGEERITATPDAHSGNDAPPSEDERLHAMRLDVAPTDKALAQRAKFGVK